MVEIITFPKHEWEIYNDYIKRKEDIATLRIFKEFQKYKVGNIYYTEWGINRFKVIKSEIFKTLEEVISKYPEYNNTMSVKQKQEIEKYAGGKIERLTLRPL